MQKTICSQKLNKHLKIMALRFDVWFSEKTLHEDGDIERAIKILQEHNFIYEHEDALMVCFNKIWR